MRLSSSISRYCFVVEIWASERRYPFCLPITEQKLGTMFTQGQNSNPSKMSVPASINTDSKSALIQVMSISVSYLSRTVTKSTCH